MATTRTMAGSSIRTNLKVAVLVRWQCAARGKSRMRRRSDLKPHRATALRHAENIHIGVEWCGLGSAKIPLEWHWH